MKCEELLQQHPDSPRLHYIKARALDSLAESHRSNKYLEEAIAAYQKTMSSKNVPEQLYILAGKRAADRMRFRGKIIFVIDRFFITVIYILFEELSYYNL